MLLRQDRVTREPVSGIPLSFLGFSDQFWAGTGSKLEFLCANRLVGRLVLAGLPEILAGVFTEGFG